jgi:integrase
LRHIVGQLLVIFGLRRGSLHGSQRQSLVERLQAPTEIDGHPAVKLDQNQPIEIGKPNPPEGSLYALRHTYVSHAIEGGVPLNVIADNCGTSVRMIEKTYAKILAEKRRDFIERGAPSFG